MKALFKIKIPLFYLIAAITVFCLIELILVFPSRLQVSNSDRTAANSTSVNGYIPCGFEIKRLTGYNYISPLLFVETECKSERYTQLLQKITAYIEQMKSAHVLNDASFYFRDPATADWTGYKEDEKYNPGSLMKVPELISVLRMEEQKPGLLNEKVFYSSPFIVAKDQKFLTKQLQPGRAYTMKELLKYMITYSDNNATILLDQNLDQKIFNNVLSDLHLPSPVPGATSYPVSAKEFSLFIRSIFNASYLTIPHSEYAAELLSTSDFKEGFIKGFPPSTKMIHKFGEAGNQIEHQLHESGIVYFNGKAFALTVMTKGADLEKLPTVITEICKIIYAEISSH